jgi:hypothetical protein
MGKTYIATAPQYGFLGRYWAEGSVYVQNDNDPKPPSCFKTPEEIAAGKKVQPQNKPGGLTKMAEDVGAKTPQGTTKEDVVKLVSNNDFDKEKTDLTPEQQVVRAIDGKYNKDSLIDKAKEYGVEFDESIKKADLIMLLISKGKAEELLKE